MTRMFVTILAVLSLSFPLYLYQDYYGCRGYNETQQAEHSLVKS